MASHFSNRISHFRRNSHFQTLLFKTRIIISSLSTFASENQSLLFYGKTLPHIFQQCTKRKAIEPGRQAHARLIVSGWKPRAFIVNRLLQMYIKCFRLEYAAKVFDRMSERDSVSWATMMFGYSLNGKVGMAQALFDLIPERDVFAWTSLISGYLQIGNCLKSVEVFVMMLREGAEVDQFVYSSILKSCAGLYDSRLGSQLHAHVLKIEANTTVGNAIVNMYAKCDDLLNAAKVFNLLPNKNIESYNTLLVGYARDGRGFEAMQLFLLLLKSDLGFDEISLSIAFSACKVCTEVRMGTQIHGLVNKTRFHDDIGVATAILDMYGKWGALEEACRVFDEMKSRDVFSWSAMVSAYAHHGYGNEALQVFGKMVLENVMPDHTTFVGVLHACAHSGLVDEALHYLCIMQKDYGLSPQIEHYSCVVDALGRSGRFIEALKFIQDMPLKANDVIWTSVLSNCRMYGNMEVAEIAARSLVQLDPQDCTAYFLLSQVYEDAGMWDEASEMHRMVSVLKPRAGCSWISSNF